MPYVIEAICTSDAVPTIRAFVTHLREDWGLPAEAPGVTPKALDSENWKELEVVYRADKDPLLLECVRDTGPKSRCAIHVREQLDTISEYRESPGKRQVTDCLARTRFIVRCRIDHDPDREEASRVLDLMAFYVGKCGAVLYLEDEGFFTDSDTPLLGWCVGDED